MSDSPVDQAIEAFAKVVTRALHAGRSLQELERQLEQQSVDQLFCSPHFCFAPPGADLAHDGITETTSGDVFGFIDEFERDPRSPRGARAVAPVLRAVLMLQDAIEAARSSLESIRDLTDSPNKVPLEQWSTQADVELRGVLGAIRVGLPPDMYPSLLPRLNANVPSRLREAIVPIAEKLEQLKSVAVRCRDGSNESQPDEKAPPTEEANDAESEKAPGDQLDGWMSQAQLVRRFEIPQHRVRTFARRLRDWRIRSIADDRRVRCERNRSHNQPRYTYGVSLVWQEVVEPFLREVPVTDGDTRLSDKG